MLNIAVLVSGGGTNLQALIDAQNSGIIKDGRITLVLSSKPGVYALTRAEQNRIPSAVISPKDFASRGDFDRALIRKLRDEKIDLIVLAGFMCILGKDFVQAFPEKIVNVHPSLIPSFCGDGFYGLKVHEAALAYGVKVTGATVHFVNEITDGGTIIAQKAVDVLPGDTPETLQKRVMEQAEWKILPEAVALLCSERTKEAKEQNR